jgi:hypothetical protein
VRAASKKVRPANNRCAVLYLLRLMCEVRTIQPGLGSDRT